MATWQALIDQAKGTFNIPASDDADEPNTDDDAYLLGVVNRKVRPMMRGKLINPSDAGYFAQQDTAIDMVAGQDTYTPSAFEKIVSLHYRTSAGTTVYQLLPERQELRDTAYNTSATGDGALIGWFYRGNSFVVRGVPDVSVASGFLPIIVPQLTDAALTDTVEFSGDFHNGIMAMLEYHLSLRRSDRGTQRDMFAYMQEQIRDVEERAHARGSGAQSIIPLNIPGSNGYA